MTTEPTLRALRGERTRLQIAESALRLFAERGYTETTVQDIATDALISPRTFYRYFATKDDPLFHRNEQAFGVFHMVLTGRIATDGPWVAVRDATHALGSEIESRSDELLPRYRLIFATPALCAREREDMRRYVTAVADALQTTIDPSPLLERSAWMLGGAVGSLMDESLRLWASRKGRPDLSTILDEGLRLVRRPLRRWPGT